jgi:hypothetical protein
MLAVRPQQLTYLHDRANFLVLNNNVADAIAFMLEALRECEDRTHFNAKPVAL